MRHDVALEGVVAHFEQVAEQMLRTGGRTRTLHVLHREAAEHQPFHEARQRFRLHRRHAFRITNRRLEAVLHRMPGRIVPHAGTQFVGENPVRPRRHLGHEIGETARGHPLGRRAHHIEIGKNRARRGAGVGLLGAFGTANGCAEAGIAIYARRRRANHVGDVQLARRQFRQVVDHAAAHGHGHDRATVPFHAGGLNGLAHFGGIAIVGMERTPIGLQHVFGNFDSGRTQHVFHAFPSGDPRTRVAHYERAARIRELLAEHRRRPRQCAIADFACLRVRCVRQRLFDQFVFHIIPFKSLELGVGA